MSEHISLPDKDNKATNGSEIVADSGDQLEPIKQLNRLKGSEVAVRVMVLLFGFLVLSLILAEREKIELKSQLNLKWIAATCVAQLQQNDFDALIIHLDCPNDAIAIALSDPYEGSNPTPIADITSNTLAELQRTLEAGEATFLDNPEGTINIHYNCHAFTVESLSKVMTTLGIDQQYNLSSRDVLAFYEAISEPVYTLSREQLPYIEWSSLRLDPQKNYLVLLDSQRYSGVDHAGLVAKRQIGTNEEGPIFEIMLSETGVPMIESKLGMYHLAGANLLTLYDIYPHTEVVEIREINPHLSFVIQEEVGWVDYELFYPVDQSIPESLQPIAELYQQRGLDFYHMPFHLSQDIEFVGRSNAQAAQDLLTLYLWAEQHTNTNAELFAVSINFFFAVYDKVKDNPDEYSFTTEELDQKKQEILSLLEDFRNGVLELREIGYMDG